METKYTQDWPAYNKAQTMEKQLFIQIADELTSFVDLKKPKKNGRPALSFKDKLFCCLLKVYGTLSGRRCISDIEYAVRTGYIKKKPHFNTILNFLHQPELEHILKKLIEYSAMPLKVIEENFAIDSSGFSTSVYSRWFDYKWGKKRDRHRIWKKAHIMVGIRTNIITSAEVTIGKAADSLYFSDLVERTYTNGFILREVAADKAYSSRENLEAVSKVGAMPYIPFKSNVTGKRGAFTVWGQMYDYFTENQEEFLEHYHKRSNAETAFHMIKRKFGGFIKAKGSIAQTNEVLCKILCHNICVLIQESFESGLDVNFCA